jgi:hypothetical protein
MEKPATGVRGARIAVRVSAKDQREIEEAARLRKNPMRWDSIVIIQASILPGTRTLAIIRRSAAMESNLSPEFGDRMDLERLARDLVGRMAVDLGADLEWIAVAHHNTEHPHVHMVIRGVGSDGQALQFRREYLKHGIRDRAEDLCTRQIGYRTSHDAAEAERREIGENRFTSLDRAILRDAHQGAQEADSANFAVAKNPAAAELPESARRHSRHILARLVVLQRMGLAELAGPTLPANCAEIGAREEESNRGYAARCAQLLGLLG